MVLGFADAIAAADAVPSVLAHDPLTVESLGATLLDQLPTAVRRAAVASGLPAGETWLLVEVAGLDAAQVARVAHDTAVALQDEISGVTTAVATDAERQAVIWRCRRDAAGLATRRPDGSEAWGGWEDAAVPPARLGDYLRGLDDLLARHRLQRGVVRALRRGLSAPSAGLRLRFAGRAGAATGRSWSPPPTW